MSGRLRISRELALFAHSVIAVEKRVMTEGEPPMLILHTAAKTFYVEEKDVEPAARRFFLDAKGDPI